MALIEEAIENWFIVVSKEVRQPRRNESRVFYGYIVVIAAFLILVITFGPHSAFGLFLNPLLEEFGWSRAVTSGAFSLSMFVYGLMSIIAGGLTDRFGPRVVVSLCGLLIGLGFMLMSQLNSLWQLYLFFGVIAGFGMSAVWVPQMSSVARWFVKRRSLMTGIIIAGAGISQLIAPPVISRLIAAFDWRLSYVILGGAILVVVILAAQFLRRDPAQMGLLPYGADEGAQPELKSETGDFAFREAVNTAQFWEVFAMLFCSGFGFMGLMVHIVPHAIELGVSAVSAANILAVMGGVGILGNYVLGSLADRIGNRQVFIIGFILMAAALFWLMSASEVWALYLFAVVFGFAFGGVGTVESPLVAGLFGLSSHGLIYGVIHVGFTVGAAAGPFLTGYIFDVNGSYQMAFLVAAVVGIVGVVASSILRPTRRRGGRI
jgi:MFS family permease